MSTQIWYLLTYILLLQTGFIIKLTNNNIL